MGNNVYEVYEAAINDNPCGHGHKTFSAAEKCAQKTIRAARRGEKFYGSEFAARLNPKKEEDVAIWVRRHLVAR